MINPKSVNVFETSEFLQELLDATASILGDPAAEVVVNTWQAEYSNKANNPAVLRKFAKVFCSSMGNSDVSDQYYYQLYEVFKDLRSQAPTLSAAPAPTLTSEPIRAPEPTFAPASPVAPAASKPESKKIVVPPAMQVFQAVVSNLSKLLFRAPIEASEQGMVLFKAAVDNALPKDAARAMLYMDWFQSGKFNYMLNVSEAELSEIIHQLYLSCCSEKGPIEADRLLDQAIKQASSLEAAFIFPPSKLL